jgi:hypothetical protein
LEELIPSSSPFYSSPFGFLWHISPLLGGQVAVVSGSEGFRVVNKLVAKPPHLIL